MPRSPLTMGHWLGAGTEPAFAWVTAPHDRPRGSGVLLLGPVGYEWWASYRTLRVLAERLAEAGHVVLRLQPRGTGNAGGAQGTTGLEAWRQGLRDGVALLAELGAGEALSLVGVRLGATIVLDEAAALGARAAVAWEPVVSGRRHVRELRLRSTAVPEGAPGAGSLNLAGSLLGPGLLDDIARLDLTALAGAAPRTLVLGGPITDPVRERLRALGTALEERDAPGTVAAIGVAAEDAIVAGEVVEQIATWLGDAPGAAIRPTPAAHDAGAVALRWGVGSVCEEVVRLGPARLVGLETSPGAADDWRGTTLVLLNSGSEPHVGPGRAWVEMARDLALAGHRVVRVDFRGWGESPDDDLAPGRPYDAHAVQDVVGLIRALDARGAGDVVLAGLCAGAWIALRAVLEQPVAAVVALNPQLYWQPGQPVEALMSDTRVRRTAEREREEAGRRSGTWDALDERGVRHPPGRWLDEIAARGVPVALLFTEGDDGLEYLHNRLARRLGAVLAGGTVTVDEVPLIDHALHRVWLRPQMTAAVDAAIRRATGFRAAPLRTIPGR